MLKIYAILLVLIAAFTWLVITNHQEPEPVKIRVEETRKKN